MISKDHFLDLLGSRLERDLRNSDNEAQLKAVMHSDERVLKIVAGPGSGKTTVLVLRALRFVFVDDILPENILITTFTRKAARELRTRWLDWGMVLRTELEPIFNFDQIDLNRCRIDTLDSIAQEALIEYKFPGTIAPLVAEASASNLILKRSAFQEMYSPNQRILDNFFANYTFDGYPPRNRGEALRVAKRLIERLIQDRVDLDSYARMGQAQSLMVKMLVRYRQRAIDTNVFDFTLLEERFLERLLDESLGEWSENLHAVLVDEYQDTNPLQEAIYFAILNMAHTPMTIVGDDDQSMYRFRGGSVELFTEFDGRCQQATQHKTYRVDMMRNFRSRPEIVRFYNAHINCDPRFASARIHPAKPEVIPTRGSGNIPVLGMFRENPAVLASDLAEFLSVFTDQRRIILDSYGREISMAEAGDLGDIVFLAHSVEEVKYNRFNSAAEQRFPGMLRDEMHAIKTQTRPNGMRVFNPRGQALRTIPDVGILLGLIILAIDPNGTVISDVMPTNEARFFLKRWRDSAQRFVVSNPIPNDAQGIRGFIWDWQNLALGNTSSAFPRDWPVLELLFKLISWIPGFQRDTEHQVWLEAIARIIANAGMASPYAMQLLQNTTKRNQGNHVHLSRLSLIRDALLPIAENEIDVDEDIMPSVPRDHLQFMTIHQAKGLEFPFVIVDVGSQFSRNHPKQRFLRFPESPSNVVRAEDDVEAHLPSPLRGGRDGMDRTFDDLVRLYYVSYSRPRSVLMLVGCENCLRYGTGRNLEKSIIPHIALGWCRDRSWSWRQPYNGRRPPVRVNTPLLLIEPWN